VLLALPLMLRNDIVFPIDHPTWAAGDIYGFADEFLWKANSDPQRLILLARLPEMMLALLLACVVYALTRFLFGTRAALFALFLSAFDPNLLAQGHIAGTDLGVTLFMAASLWGLLTALKRMSWTRALVAGLLAGAALATKYSAVWLGPIALIVTIIYPSIAAKSSGANRLRLLLIFGAAAFVVIWATFGFSIGSITPTSLVVPAPDYWTSLGSVGNRVESNTPAFLQGQIAANGFWLYYPFVILLKTPLLTLILLLVGSVSLLHQRDRKTSVLWLAPLIFLAAAMLSRLSLGYRLILPILPFMLVIAGRGLEQLWRWQPQRFAMVLLQRRVYVSNLIAALASIWLVVGTLASAPEQVAYFNELAGDRSRDYNLLVDSNLDWGQDLILLREWLNTQPLNSINLAYFGTARPEAYHVPANLLPSFPLNDFGPEVDGFSSWALQPGYYAISATSLQLGLLYSHWDLYAPFRQREPLTRAGRSLLIYRIDYPSAEIDRTVVLGPVAGDLDQATLGGQSDRQLVVKWAGTDAAVLSMTGSARYITRGGEPLIGFAPAVHDALLARAVRLGSDITGDLRLFEIDARGLFDDRLQTLIQNPITTPDLKSIDLPVGFEGGLSLIGYNLTAEPDQPIDLVTYWRVDQTPQPPLSIFAHAVGAEGQIAAQRDGLNVKLSSLEPGDVVMQHFTLEHPAGVGALEIGLYNPSTGQRKLTDQNTDRVELVWK
jgi:hypothetical protein